MPNVTFIKSFSLEEDETTTTTWPEGWTGNVSDDIAELAAKKGCFEVADDLADDAEALADKIGAGEPNVGGDLPPATDAAPVADAPPPVAPAEPAKKK